KGLSAGRAIIKSFQHNGLLVPGNAHGKRHDFSNHTRLFHESITVCDNHIVNPKHKHSDSYFEHCYSDGESLLSIDLGVSYNLIGAQIKSNTFPGIYKIEVKNRCEDWVTLVDKLNQQPNGNNQYDYFAANARFIRIHYPHSNDE